MVKVYQVWPGNNKFYCNGRLITSKETEGFYGTLGLIVVPTVLFWVFVCYPLVVNWNNVLPLLLSLYGTCCMFSTLFITSFMDPGIIPRAPAPAVPPKEGEGESSEIPSQTVVVGPQGASIEMKWCSTCNIYRPPRTSHCSQCNNCVLQFDHHCPWVGNCIGRRNYRFFVIFVWSVILNSILICATTVYHLVMLSNQHASGILGALSAAPASAVLFVFCLVIVCSVLALGGFHAYLISVGQTTNEDIKKSFELQDSPYDNGFLHNLNYTLCGPFFPTVLNLQEEAQELHFDEVILYVEETDNQL